MIDLGSLRATLRVDDEVQFAHERPRWRVRGITSDDRFAFLTAWSQTGEVIYTIIDWESHSQGPISLGGGLRIDSLSGQDDDVNTAMEMLEEGSGISHFNVMPVWITAYFTSNPRGPVIDGSKLSEAGRLRVWEWLQANGCRWFAPWDATIRINGNHIVIGTWNIRRIEQAGSIWPRQLNGVWSPPLKTRRFRIRTPLNPKAGRS